MELETTVKETSTGLKSSRAVDRKKSAETLKDFLSRNTVPSLLTRNTLQKRGLTWNNVFDDINEFILKETEKFETSKSYNTNTRPLCASILHSCVAGANRGKVYIKCDKITEACVYILSDNRMLKAIGDEYLSLLLKHVLSHKHYSSYITPNAWKELLDVCIAACLSEHLQLDNYAKLRIVYLVMKNGSDNCQFIKPLVASLVEVEKCFTKLAPDKKALDVNVEITTLLLEVLSTEYRLTMCQFIENNLPLLLKYYDQNKDHKKKSSLFKLLYLAIELHHPEGRLQNMESSLAYNWDLWNRYLKGIAEIVYMEVNYLQKNKKHSEKCGQWCSYFMRLASFIHYQMFESSATEEEDGANSSKRLKLSFHNNKCFSDLLSELHQNFVPWLGIVNAYVKFYGTNISDSDYITLLNHLQVLLASDNNLHWEAFEELTCLVIKRLQNNKNEEYDNATISLWNTCVRNCTTVNTSHKPIHAVIQCILKARALNYEHVQHVIKLYFEKDMPVTDSSVNSLSTLFYTFYSKYSSVQIRLGFVNWLTQNDISNINAPLATELILRILASENLGTLNIGNTETLSTNLHDVIYNTIGKTILFAEFEEEIQPKSVRPEEINELELINDVNNSVLEYFKKALTDKISALRTDVSILGEHMKLIYIVLIYNDVITKYRFKTREEMMNLDTYALLKQGLSVTFSSLIRVLKSKEQIPIKFAMLSLVQEMLTYECDDFLSDVLRLSIDGDFFHCINHILNSGNEMGDSDVVIEGDDREINMHTLKHNCIYTLAAYCRKSAEYREDILKLILDPDLYNFSTDTGCIFRCIDILMEAKVENPPYEQIFRMMQAICKDLYRDSTVSFGIMKILVNLIDHIYSQENAMKDNCFIMVKGYMQLCEDSYYSPKVAALIYQCLAKIAVLNRKHSTYVDTTFENVLIKKLKGDIHSVRLYCSYLLKDIICEYSEDEIDTFFRDLSDIFVIEVDEKHETVIKDESANRTFTLLHAFYAAALGKHSCIQTIVLQMIYLQNVKSLDKHAVKKVLNKIVNIIKIRDLSVYLNNNILAILHFWFSKGYVVEKLPLYLLGFDSLDLFIKMHMKWLVAAEILWKKKGNINESEILQRITSQGLTADSVLETCFSNIIILCLPYIVCDKMNLNHYGTETLEEFCKSKRYASRLYQSMGEMLENNKWSTLFVENVGDLLQLTAIHLWDSDDAERMFRTTRKLPSKCGSFYYPKQVFTAILEYFQELTDGNVIHYLCVNQTTTVFKILIELWKNVVQENVFEHKVLALYAFLVFLKNVPLNCPSDAFVCNFVCKSFSHVIKDSCDKDELRIYMEGLKIAMSYLLPSQIPVMRKSVTELMPLLIIKKEEGFQKECSNILNYMKNYLKDGEDLVDFFGSMSQDSADSLYCTSITVFLEKLKSYKISLKCPSYEILANIRKFLVANQRYVRTLWDELEPMRFSEDCQTSIVHEFVHSLGFILKSNYDDKTIIEACYCLSEIGTYELKTLVTLPPSDTQELAGSNPKHFFALTVVKSLLEVLFDKNPVVIARVGDTLTNIMKSRQFAQSHLGLNEIQMLVLKPFLPANPSSGDVQVDNIEFEYYCEKYPDGVFLTALTATSVENGEWLKQVTRTLLKMFRSTTNYFVDLRAVCGLKSQICNDILPALVGLLIECLSERQTKVISHQLNIFYNHIWDLTFDDKVENSGDSRGSLKTSDILPHARKAIVQYMLGIVDFLRVQRNNRVRSGSAAKQLNFLDLEYNKVAWAAAIADQNWAAIYYGELWAVLQNNGVSPSSPDSTTNLDGGAKLQQILRKCYVSISEIDAIEGCGTAHLIIEDEKRKHLINTGQYSDALVMYDIALSCGIQVDHSLNLGVVRALHKSGMHHMALQYIKSQPENEEFNDIKYECLSFLGDWSEFVDLRELEQKSKEVNCHHNSVIKAFQYSCLKTCLNVEANREHENVLLLPMNKAKLAVSRLSRNLNMDNCQNVYKILAKIHLFNDINDYLSVRTDKLQLSHLLRQWNLETFPKFQHFKHVEALISQRVMILEHAAKSNDNLLDEISSLQIQYAKMALSNNRVEMAQRLLAMAKKSRSSNDFILLESEISWAKGHKDIALSLLHKIVTSQTLEPTLTAISMRQYALWMAESKRDKPRDIINKYLLKSVRLLQSDHVEARLKLYQDIAKFADAEYKQVLAYMKSSVYENRVKCVESMRGTASSLNKKSQKKLTKEELRALSTNEKFRVLDEAEIANTKMEKENFLQLAMRYYLLSLKECDENNLSVFRVISLWLENQQFEFTTDGDGVKFDRLLQQIPSRKFITALPQLAPHLTEDDSAFITNLKIIIKRCAVDHPHHTLPILFGLKNSNKDNVIMNASRSVGGSASQLRNQEARTVAAHGLVQELATQSDELALIISQMEKLCDAIISFANYKVQTKQPKQKIPDAEMLQKLKKLTTVPIPTVVIPLRADCNYSNIHTLNGFDPHFELVGGVNCPKKVNCKDSAGKNHVILIKGQDDLRQDAVMQQVFNIVNTLLKKDVVTNRNKLLIRTYKVVPMSRQSGVLEWCEGTTPLGTYLVGPNNTGAHARYRPQDISCDAARRKMIECQDESHEDKLAMFNRIRREFKPVFHYFFTEHYLNPVVWYERRLAYTKSVATSSMVGYILGLGDRHVYNILIDQRTAEVIHIDLGIAFDQGKTLRTPETVPFRLTQDIVAGFGCSGVEGIFRRSCEKTMQLLRDNQETLLTILEVLLCDPLYSWSVKTAQQNDSNTRLNNDISTSDSHSGLAKRALLVVSSKLSGTEDGVAGGVAVPGQVARLLNSATDAFNLCRLFHGWQPYL